MEGVFKGSFASQGSIQAASLSRRIPDERLEAQTINYQGN